MSFSNKDKEIFQNAELQREFQVQEFSTVVNQLLNTLQILANFRIQDAYYQIKEKSGKVIGKDILRLVHVVKQDVEVQMQLDREIKFYKETIHKMTTKGKSIITIGEFFVLFALENPNKGIVTEEIQQQISQYKNISVGKLFGLIEEIQNSRRLTNRLLKPQLQIEQYKTESNNLESDLFDDQKGWDENNLRWILSEIKDEEVGRRLENMMEGIKIKLAQNAYTIGVKQEQIANFEKRGGRAMQEITRLQKQIQEKEILICKLHEQNQLYAEQIEIFERKCQQDFIHTITKLSEENNKLFKQKQQILSQYEKITKQLQWVSVNYKDISQQYQILMASTDCLRKEENINVVDHELPVMLKQQLHQAYDKITKLSKINEDLSIKIIDLETELESKAIISNPLTDQTFNNLALDEKLPNNFEDDPKQTFLYLLRRKQNQEQIEDSFSNDLKYQRCKSISLIRSITKEYFQSEKKPTTNNFSTHETNQTNFHCLASKTPNTSYTLRQYDFAGFLDTDMLKGVTGFIQNFDINMPNKPLFSSQVWTISLDGPQQKLILLLSSNRIIFCQANFLSIKQTFEISSISEFCFCQSMRTWLVVKFKQGVLDSKGKNIRQMVIQIGNRAQLVKYLFKNGFICAQNQTTLNFRKEEQIMVELNKKRVNLSCFEGTKNLLDKSMNDGQNVFEVKINEYITFFCKSVRVVIVINSIGILVFQRNKSKGVTTFEQKQKLKYILPFCEQMQIIDLGISKCIKIVYGMMKKSVTIEFENYGLAKIGGQKVIWRRQQVVKNRKREDGKSKSIFTALKKMRSLEDQDILTSI